MLFFLGLLSANILDAKGSNPLLDELKTYKKLLTYPISDLTTARNFIKTHGNWPKISIIRAKYEIALSNSNADPMLFYQHTYPTTLELQKKLLPRYKASMARGLARNMLLKNKPTKELLDKISPYITDHDIAEKIDRLLWEDKDASFLKSYMQHNSETNARINLAKNNYVDGPRTVGVVYEKIKYYKRNRNHEMMLKLLNSVDVPEDKEQFFWLQRHILTRRYLESKEYTKALLAVSNHHLKNKLYRVEAEWLRGWILHVFLHQSKDAREIFINLYNHVQSPISRARMAYWTACTYKSRTQAEVWYRKAAQYPVVFYGQLARERLHIKGPILKRISYNHGSLPNTRTIQIIDALLTYGERELAIGFFENWLVSQAKNESMQHFIPLFAKDDAFQGTAIRKLQYSEIPYIKDMYPVFRFQVTHNPILRCIIHALAFRETMFNPFAVGDAGEQGIMQFMPSTAKRIGKKYGLPYSDLFSPKITLPLARAYLDTLLTLFSGYLVPTLAGYNAGEHKVTEWLQNIGDPRKNEMLWLNWIELIPFKVTRDYVQRALENIYLYQERLDLHDKVSLHELIGMPVKFHN